MQNKKIYSRVIKMLLNIALVSLFLLTAFSCENSVDPPEDKPGRRDYVWTVDTLDAPYNVYFRMWGSSPADVWTVSSSNWDKSIAHFDGQKWSFHKVEGLFNLHAIYGFSSNNIFVGADNGGIWRYNGTNWNQFAKLKKEGTNVVAFENIWGESSSDFYVVGSGPDDGGYFNRSIIAHYNNNKWTMINTDELKGDVVHFYKNKPDNKIYFRLTKVGGAEHIDSTIIYEFAEGNFYKIYSSLEIKGYQADISLINSEVYFILGNEIAKRKDNQFKTLLNINSTNFYHRIWGRNSKDIFLLMTDGLAHYNGNDIEYLFHFNMADAKPWTQIFGAAIFEKEVFFLTYEPPTRLKLIYHGKLKE